MAGITKSVKLASARIGADCRDRVSSLNIHRCARPHRAKCAAASSNERGRPDILFSIAAKPDRQQSWPREFDLRLPLVRKKRFPKLRSSSRPH